jgi:hypothetical protein
VPDGIDGETPVWDGVVDEVEDGPELEVEEGVEEEEPPPGVMMLKIWFVLPVVHW